MSTSLLYHAWGLKNYRYVSTEYADGMVTFNVEKKREKQRCAGCGSSKVMVCGVHRERTWKSLPIGLRPVLVRYSPRELACDDCGKRLQEPLEFAEERKSFCKRLARLAVDLASLLPLSHVGALLDLNEKIVRELVKKSLGKKAKKNRLVHLRRLAVDEICVSKRPVCEFLTIVLDLDSGRVVHVADGRDSSCLDSFFRSLRASGATITAVAMDMSKAYIAAVRKGCREAEIVFDPFHVVKLMNERVDEVRRAEHKRLKDTQDEDVIKGTRYLLLKNPEKLKETGKQRLERLLAINENISKTYILKEELRALWQCRSRREGENYIDEWRKQALATGLGPLKRMANTLDAHKEGLLAYFAHHITSGPLEGLNNKIKLLMRSGYGYRDRVFFKLRILFHHEAKLVLTGA